MAFVRLAVIDDHALFRAGLISLLNDMKEFRVIGEAGDGTEALRILNELKPDVLLLDVNMPRMGGVETVAQIRSLPEKEQCKILMLTISENDKDLIGSISAGADGYLLKNAEPEELQKAIILVHQGMSVLSPQITRKVLNAVGTAPSTSFDSGLSNREMEVLECLTKGYKTDRIAQELFISENTVKTHVRHILEKMSAANRAEAVSKALQMGLFNND